MIHHSSKSHPGSDIGCRGAVAFAAGLLCLAVPFISLAEIQPGEQLNLGVPAAKTGEKNPPESSGEGVGAVGLPYSQILLDTEPPYENLFRDVRVGGRFDEKIGPGDLFIQPRLLNGPRFNTPLFQRGVRPEESELKLGKLYFDLRAVSAGLIYSDNVFQRETHEKDGVIGIIRLTMAVMFQVTDNLRLATHGTLAYLPFRNRVGISGFGVDDPFARFEDSPNWETQLSYDIHMGGWEINLVDDFRIHQRRFGANASFDLFDGERFDEEDRAGRYVFRDRGALAPGARPTNNDFGEDFFEMRNLVGAVARRMLPTETRLEVGAFHSDSWHSNTRDTLLPSSRDSAYAALISERETLRFKPFIRYRVSRSDSDPWDQEVRVGFRGPITENLNFYGDVGYFDQGGSDHNSYLARVRIRHTPGPMTFHEFEFNRGVTEPDGDIENSYRYLIRRILGPDFYGELYGLHAEFEDLHGLGRSGQEWRAAARLTYNLGNNVILRASGSYVNFNYDNNTNRGDYDAWIARMEVLYRLTRSFHARFIYQYQIRDSTRAGESYDENFLGLNLIKYF